MDPRAILERLSRGQKGQRDIHAFAAMKGVGQSQTHAASEVCSRGACKIQCSALSRNGLIRCCSMNLNSADPDFPSAWKQLQFVISADAAGNEGSRNHRSETFHGEHAVDWQTGDSTGIPGRYLRGYIQQRPLQLLDTRAGQRADSKDGCLRYIEK